MANPNIVSVSSILGETVGIKLTTAQGLVGILTNTSASGKVYKINTIRCSNITGAATTAYIDIGINQVSVGTTFYLANQIEIPGGSTLLVVDKEGAFYLKENIRVAAACTSQNVDIVISYEDIT